MSNEQGLPKATRYPALDLLRLVAIGMTLLAHSSNLVARIPGLRDIRLGLWLGVDLFMLISGWLLGGQLLREARGGTLEPRRFYFKRWMRTLPPYLVMLVVLYFFAGTQFSGPLPWTDIFAQATFSQVYADRNHYGVSWSLSVEEHFYLLLPGVIWLFMRWPTARTVIAVVAGTELFSIICRAVAFPAQDGIPLHTHLRWHGLFLGMGMAWLALHRPQHWASVGRYATALGLIGIPATLGVMASLPNVPRHPWTYIGAATVGTWTLGLVFLACVHERSIFSRVNFPGLRYLGELTYAIYLTHDVLPRWLIEVGGPIASVRGTIWRLGLVAVASLLLHHLVERPALWFRDRWLAAHPKVQAPRLAT